MGYLKPRTTAISWLVPDQRPLRSTSKNQWLLAELSIKILEIKAVQRKFPFNDYSVSSPNNRRSKLLSSCVARRPKHKWPMAPPRATQVSDFCGDQVVVSYRGHGRVKPREAEFGELFVRSSSRFDQALRFYHKGQPLPFQS